MLPPTSKSLLRARSWLFARCAAWLFVFLLFVGACVAADYACTDFLGRQFERSALTVQNVRRVVDYIDYEGSRSTTVELSDGRLLSFSGFRLSAFGEVKPEIHLDGIGDRWLVCRLDKGDPLSRSAVSLNEVLHALGSDIRAYDLGDLVSQVDRVDALLVASFSAELAQAHPVNLLNVAGERALHWCHWGPHDAAPPAGRPPSRLRA